MKIKTVSVTYGRKINLGDYNSAQVDCTLWADIEMDENGHPIDDLDAVMRDLWGMAKENVKAQIVPLAGKGQANSNVKELFLGLPSEYLSSGE